jgi:hypothetical protein
MTTPANAATEGIDASIADNLRISLFSYDIPSDSGFPNPSGFLRRFCLRFNKSDWLVSAADIPRLMPLIHEMLKIGATPRLRKFDRSESIDLVRDGIKWLEKEAKDYIDRAKLSQRKAEQKLETDNDSAENRHEGYKKRSEEINKRLVEMAEVVNEVSGRFGILPNAIKIAGFKAEMDKLNDTMKARADAFMKAVNVARQQGTVTGTALAAGMMAGTVDVGVMADYLDEEVKQGEGDDLRETFSLNPDEHGTD